jgi:hypothetical protein
VVRVCVQGQELLDLIDFQVSLIHFTRVRIQIRHQHNQGELIDLELLSQSVRVSHLAHRHAVKELFAERLHDGGRLFFISEN